MPLSRREFVAGAAGLAAGAVGASVVGRDRGDSGADVGLTGEVFVCEYELIRWEPTTPRLRGLLWASRAVPVNSRVREGVESDLELNDLAETCVGIAAKYAVVEHRHPELREVEVPIPAGLGYRYFWRVESFVEILAQCGVAVSVAEVDRALAVEYETKNSALLPYAADSERDQTKAPSLWTMDAVEGDFVDGVFTPTCEIPGWRPPV